MAVTNEQFLFSCIEHSNGGTVNWQGVADQCGIPSKAAAAIKFKRMKNKFGIVAKPTDGDAEDEDPKPKKAKATSAKKPVSKKRKKNDESEQGAETEENADMDTEVKVKAEDDDLLD